MNRTRRRRGAALVAGLSLLLQPTLPIVAAMREQTPPATKPAPTSPQTPPASKPTTTPAQTPKTPTPTPTGTKPAAATTTAAAAAPIDGGWPRMYDLPTGGTILMLHLRMLTARRTGGGRALSVPVADSGDRGTALPLRARP